MPRRPPPGGPGRPVCVLRIPQSGDHVVMFLGPLQGHLEHWFGRGTAPCEGPGSCKVNHAQTPPLFYAYAPVGYLDARNGLWAPWVLQATSNLEELLRGRQLRGEVWLLARVPGERKTEKLQGTFVERADPAAVPPEFDISPPLCKVFGRRVLNLGVPNPNPATLRIDQFNMPELGFQATPIADPSPEPARQTLRRISQAVNGTPGPNLRDGPF